MKKIIICLVLCFLIVSVKSQSKWSIGLTPAFTFNINHSIRDSHINDFDVISNYPSLKSGVSLLLELKPFALTLNTNYHWGKYGWRHTYHKQTAAEGSVYNLDEVVLSTESISGDVMASIYIIRFFHDKALLLFDIGAGYSLIQHTSLFYRYKISVQNSYFSKALNYNQVDPGFDVGSFFIIGGVSAQAILRKIGKIKYGVHYAYYFKSLPEMSMDLDINHEVFINRLETKHSYFEVFLTYFFLNFEKRDKNSKCHKVSYK